MHSDFPIEHLALSSCKRWLASASHDQSVKIWDVGYLQEAGEGAEEEAGEGAPLKRRTAPPLQHNAFL